jgi:hypothetical protein
VNISNEVATQVVRLINDESVKHDEKNYLIIAAARYINSLNGQDTSDIITVLYKMAAMETTRV